MEGIKDLQKLIEQKKDMCMMMSALDNDIQGLLKNVWCFAWFDSKIVTPEQNREIICLFNYEDHDGYALEVLHLENRGLFDEKGSYRYELTDADYWQYLPEKNTGTLPYKLQISTR
jgi:hypothetical protein